MSDSSRTANSSRTAEADWDAESDDGWIEPDRIQDVSARAVRPGASGYGVAIASAGSSSTKDRPKKTKVKNKSLTRDELASESGSDSHFVWPDTHSSDRTHSSGTESEPSKGQWCGQPSSYTNSATPLGLSVPVGESGPVIEDTETSIGSAYHDQGTCKPCILIFSKLGCRKGAECQFCHRRSHLNDMTSSRPGQPKTDSDGAAVNCPWERPLPSKNRPGKGQRERYKKMIAREVEIAA